MSDVDDGSGDPANPIGNAPKWARDIASSQRYTLELVKQIQLGQVAISTNVGQIIDEQRRQGAQLDRQGKQLVALAGEVAELKRTDAQLAADLLAAEGSLVSRVARLEAKIDEIEATQTPKRSRRVTARR